MKNLKRKLFVITLVFVFAFFAFMPSFAFADVIPPENILQQIAEKINNSSLVATIKSFGYEITASTDVEKPNILVISEKNTGDPSTVLNFELSGKILSYEQLTEDSISTFYIVADAIGQVNGYTDGELAYNLSLFLDDVMQEYTVENEGIDIKKDGEKYSIKMDVTKKTPLMDLNSLYLKTKDFDMLKEFVEEGNTGNTSYFKSKLSYDITLSENENVIYMGEKPELTESAYKSILSALEVMYGEKAVEFFQELYPNFDEGLTIINGVSIDYDVDDLSESPMFAGMKVVKVKIDNKFMKDVVLRTEYVGEIVDGGSKTIDIDFNKNASYIVNLLDDIDSSDMTFFIGCLLDTVVNETENFTFDGDTAYFNVKDGKIVVGSKDDSLFKVIVKDDEVEILPTKMDVVKTTAVAKHDDIKMQEYREDAISADMFRYVKYNVTVNITYGNKPSDYRPNPDTGKIDINYLKISEIF